MRSPAEGARASEDTHAGQQKDACPRSFSVSAAATSCQRFDRRYELERIDWFCQMHFEATLQGPARSSDPASGWSSGPAGSRPMGRGLPPAVSQPTV